MAGVALQLAGRFSASLNVLLLEQAALQRLDPLGDVGEQPPKLVELIGRDQGNVGRRQLPQQDVRAAHQRADVSPVRRHCLGGPRMPAVRGPLPRGLRDQAVFGQCVGV